MVSQNLLLLKRLKLQLQPQRHAISCTLQKHLSRARESTLKPNMCSSLFITLGPLGSACVPPLLQSILFNSLGMRLLTQICRFLQVFAAHLRTISWICQFSRRRPELCVEGPTCRSRPAARRPPLIYNLLLYCHHEEHNQPCRDATEIH